MRTRSVLACLVAAAAAWTTVTVPADAAARPRAISTCSASGHYGLGRTIARDSYLTRNLTCQKGFVLDGGATLDLRGHTLTGVDDPMWCVGCPGEPAQEQPGHAGIVLVDGHVVNGKLKGWNTGVRVLAASPASGEVRSVARVTVTGSDVGVYAEGNTDTVELTRATLEDNNVGVRAFQGGGYRIDRSTLSRNHPDGLEMESSGDLKITGSTFHNNSFYGLRTDDAQGVGLLHDNSFSYNGGDGAVAAPSDLPLVVSDNVAFGNRRRGMVFLNVGGGGTGPVVDLGGNTAGANIGGDCFGITCGEVAVPPDA